MARSPKKVFEVELILLFLLPLNYPSMSGIINYRFPIKRCSRDLFFDTQLPVNRPRTVKEKGAR